MHAEINTIRNQLSSISLLGSSEHVNQLCSVLLNKIEEYFKNEFLYAVNSIKAGKMHLETVRNFSVLIGKDMTAAIHEHFGILVNEIRKICVENYLAEKFVKELDFQSKAISILKAISNEFEATYAEYLEYRSQSRKTLHRANIANFIAFVSLIVSVISIYDSSTIKNFAQTIIASPAPNINSDMQNLISPLRCTKAAPGHSIQVIDEVKNRVRLDLFSFD